MKIKSIRSGLIAIGMLMIITIACNLPLFNSTPAQDETLIKNTPGTVQEYKLPGIDLVISYKVSKEGQAVFWFDDHPNLSPLFSSVESGEAAVMTWQGETIDGYGALGPSESQVIDEIFSSLYGQALPLVALERACEERSSLSDKQVAALFYPWQIHLKYAAVDRMEEIQRFLNVSNCLQRINQATLNADDENSPVLLVSNDSPFPVVLGYFPFDPDGAYELADVPNRNCVLSENTLETHYTLGDRMHMASDIPFNETGPCGAKCRGSCGVDCTTDNCKVDEVFRCITDPEGALTGFGYPVQRYTCGINQGCIDHDACYDSCNRAYGCWNFWAAWCRHGVRQGNCDGDSFANHGVSQSGSWARGKGPFTGTMVFDYTVDPNQESNEDLEACPAKRELDITTVTPVQFTISGEFEETLIDDSFPIDLHLCSQGRGRFSFTFWNVGALAGGSYDIVTAINTSTPYFEYFLAEWESGTQDRCVTHDYAVDNSGSDYRFSGGPNGVLTLGGTLIGSFYEGRTFQFTSVAFSPRTFSVPDSSVFAAWK